jgi:hypothetical protein
MVGRRIGMGDAMFQQNMPCSSRTRETYYYGKRDTKKTAIIASASAGQPVAEIGKPVWITVYNTVMANVS